MCIFYIIHSLTTKTLNDNDGSKNTRTFLFGSLIYIVLYMMSMHYALKNPISYGILSTGLILLFIADISAMAFVYKSYYGRFITNEITETDNDWKFNKEEHTYKKKTEG